MPNPDNKTTETAPVTRNVHIVCPFCAMLCDDLSLSVHSDPGSLDARGCAKADAAFSLALGHTSQKPMINGHETNWSDAIEHARGLLQSAHLPLFHGLLGDLEDCQGALRLAERFGGVVDHADGDAMATNLAVYQDSGWISTSLGEVRNRADLVILVGDAIDASLPRLRERLFDVRERLHTESSADVVALGSDCLDTLDQVRTLLRGHPLSSPSPEASGLHEKLLASRYPVIAPILADHDDAELVLRAAADIVRIINEQNRAALMMLSTGMGGATAQHASTWHGGFGIRTSFAAGYPEQDLRRYAAHELLAVNEADLLIWISSLNANPPPRCKQRKIVIGHPATAFDGAAPEVFLPVAVPGIHRNGFIHRGDGLHMLPLRALVTSTLTGTLDIVGQLLATPTEEATSC